MRVFFFKHHHSTAYVLRYTYCRASIRRALAIRCRGLIIPKPQIFCTYRKSTQYITQKCDWKRACERSQVIFCACTLDGGIDGIVASYGIYAIHIVYAHKADRRARERKYTMFNWNRNNNNNNNKKCWISLGVAAATRYDVTCDTNDSIRSILLKLRPSSSSSSRISHQSFAKAEKKIRIIIINWR